jgi:CRP-like cAMP-binding protein
MCATIGTMTELSRALLAAARRRTKAAEELEAARLHLAEQIRADVAAGVRQVDIVKATGYTREQVRRLAAGRTT